MIKIKDKAIIFSIDEKQEGLYILTLLTENHGLYSSIIKKIKNKGQLIYNIGDVVDFFWTARLPEHIGCCKLELLESNIFNIMNSKEKLFSLRAIIEMILKCFRNKDPQKRLFIAVQNYLLNLRNTKFSILEHIKLEMFILQEAGYGLDLSTCVVTGKRDNLYYVSPKSGKAVSKDAGAKYSDKLFILPQFILKNLEPDLTKDISEMKKLFDYFLYKYVLNDDSILPFRNNFYNSVV